MQTESRLAVVARTASEILTFLEIQHGGLPSSWIFISEFSVLRLDSFSFIELCIKLDSNISYNC